jgi:hypothetical protein
MQIKQMFKRDINRYINGVVSVGENKGVQQELEEYVVTHELQRHFSDFFEAFEEGLDNPARNTGVWIQGYFGSGKSHFLKMLSYLLENKKVNERPAVDYFNEKFEDPLTFARIERVAQQVNVETILFNIDEKGGGYKEGDTSETAVLRSTARVFYEHLGFYGRDYKLARFEKMIDSRGKTEEFRAAYEEITGNPWLEDRESYDMFGEEVAQAANKALGLSIQSITDWADSTENTTVDFAELVGDINEYAEKQEKAYGKNFRLVFMVDEMGQYLNGDVSRMLNLQTLVEQFCDKCNGRVWMVVTSQEAIDEMISVVSMDFSKIQGRFSTRLSLSSSSVDEVIKKRVLDKNDSAKLALEGEYQAKSIQLKNLFSFRDSRSDLKGFTSETEFVESFPFVGYQFTIMPDVLNEIRRHGYQGKSLSTGERSMLSSYQEAGQAVEDSTETSLVPFWRFFDTLEKECDHGIKQLFERARKAVNNDYLKTLDIDVLKVLYLINYINDIKPTLDNISILMIDDIEVDILRLKEQVKASLDRLIRENYVSRNGERYSFLTDEEQDIAREIKAVNIDTSKVIEEIKNIIFNSIYTDTKFKKGANDFSVDRYVDDTVVGRVENGMKLNIITLANSELSDATNGELDLKSINQALIVLDKDNDYYDLLYDAARIKQYAQTQNLAALSQSKRNIIQAKQEQANQNRKDAEALIKEAIVAARVSINGHGAQIAAPNARLKIEQVLDKLVECTFTKSGYVDNPIESDGELIRILTKGNAGQLDGVGSNNANAIEEMNRYLDSRVSQRQNTTMGDIQRHFKEKPYGWRDIDIAAVIAQLIFEQKVSVLRAGAQIAPSDSKMRDYLRNSREIDSITIKKRVALPQSLIASSKSIIRELDSTLSVPTDEDGLVEAVKNCLEERIARYTTLNKEYLRNGLYPGRSDVEKAISLARGVLANKADSEALLRELVSNEDEFLDNNEALEDVEKFFNGKQKEYFNQAISMLNLLANERCYVEADQDIQESIQQLKEIINLEKPYSRIQEIPDLCKQIDEVYGALVRDKRNDLLTSLENHIKDIEDYANQDDEYADSIASILSQVEQEAAMRKNEIHNNCQTCSALDAKSSQLMNWREQKIKSIDNAIQTIKKQKTSGGGKPPVVKPTKVLNRSSVLPSKNLSTEQEINDYVEAFRSRLLNELEPGGSIRLGN